MVIVKVIETVKVNIYMQTTYKQIILVITGYTPQNGLKVAKIANKTHNK